MRLRYVLKCEIPEKFHEDFEVFLLVIYFQYIINQCGILLFKIRKYKRKIFLFLNNEDDMVKLILFSDFFLENVTK